MKVRAPQADRYMTNGTRDVAVRAHGVAQQTATRKRDPWCSCRHASDVRLFCNFPGNHDELPHAITASMFS